MASRSASIEGEIVSLLGRNGVGRSTTIKAIMGVVPPKGSIRFKGDEIVGLKPHQTARRGLGYVAETRDIFPGADGEAESPARRKTRAMAASAGR